MIKLENLKTDLSAYRKIFAVIIAVGGLYMEISKKSNI
jgi:hypothetical protein